MLNLHKGENGKAANAAPETFFQQYIPVPNKFNPNEITMVPLPGTGIPMRDYFAAKIAAAFVADVDNENFTAIARDAYRLAGEMLKARQVSVEEYDRMDRELGEQFRSQFHEDYGK